uniref:Uncharacterized protein n=1 Tax=Sphaerodactylus townsendi TaxID=933632 RepID=A0ACB8F4M9_9SAUR
MYSTSMFTNPYAIEVLKTKKDELVEGINNPDYLVNWLIDNGILAPEKKMVLSYYKTRIAKNSRVLDILISQGNLSDLEKSLKNTDINAVNPSNETLLHIAAAHGHVKIIDYLISKGAKLDVKDKKGRIPLHIAAEKGHNDAVKILLQAGANMYSLDQEGKTPLHLASRNHHTHVLKSILGEEVRRYKYQHNFLHMAALKDDSNLVQILLKHGAPVDAKDETGQTALGYAVSQGFEKTVKVLLEAGATIDSGIIDAAFNSNNQSVFKLLLDYSKGLSPDTMVSALYKAIQKDLYGIVAALIERGTDINAHNEMHYTPLLVACEMGKTESAKVLVDMGASLKDKTPNSNSALHLAVQAGASSIVKMLLGKGMDANLAGQGDQTPLHVAALHNKGALVGLLIDAGAKINAVTKELLTPLHMASHKGHVDVAQKLLHYKANVNLKDKRSKTPLHLTAETESPVMVELLLNSGADPNAVDKEKKTPLHLAAIGGHLNTGKALLSRNGRFGAKDMDGCTSMHYAAINGNTEIVQALLVAGKKKNIDDRNIWRKIPLHLAAEHGHSNLVQLLLNNGSAINALDNNKDTPLHCACKAGHFDCVSILVHHSVGEKANLQATNSLKKTPLQVAESSSIENQAQIVTLLKKKMLLIK